jgi:hypothetical protein
MEQNGLSDVEGKAAREAVSEVGAKRVSTQSNPLARLRDLRDLCGERSDRFHFQRVEDNAFHLRAYVQGGSASPKTMRKTDQRSFVF